MSQLQDLPSVAVSPDAVRPMSRAWGDRLRGYAWHAQTIGCSEAEVFRLTGDGLPSLFVKSEPIGPFAELRGEIDRLRWLTGSVPADADASKPRRKKGRLWLLMSEVPGRDLASSPDLSPLQIAEIAADALRELHALDVALCPFDQRLAAKLAQAEANVAAGRVDEGDMDERTAWSGLQPVSLEEALALRPAKEDLVVAHGDACMPNLMAEHGRFTGFIDCGRLGVADRHQDLALAAWSIECNLRRRLRPTVSHALWRSGRPGSACTITGFSTCSSGARRRIAASSRDARSNPNKRQLSGAAGGTLNDRHWGALPSSRTTRFSSLECRAAAEQALWRRQSRNGMILHHVDDAMWHCN